MLARRLTRDNREAHLVERGVAFYLASVTAETETDLRCEGCNRPWDDPIERWRAD